MIILQQRLWWVRTRGTYILLYSALSSTVCQKVLRYENDFWKCLVKILLELFCLVVQYFYIFISHLLAKRKLILPLHFNTTCFIFPNKSKCVVLLTLYLRVGRYCQKWLGNSGRCLYSMDDCAVKGWLLLGDVSIEWEGCHVKGLETLLWDIYFEWMTVLQQGWPILADITIIFSSLYSVVT